MTNDTVTNDQDGVGHWDLVIGHSYGLLLPFN